MGIGDLQMTELCNGKKVYKHHFQQYFTVVVIFIGGEINRLYMSHWQNFINRGCIKYTSLKGSKFTAISFEGHWFYN
jgi:hypothetical protein